MAKGTKKRNVTVGFNDNDKRDKELIDWYEANSDKTATYIKEAMRFYKEFVELKETVNKMYSMFGNTNQMGMMKQMASVMEAPSEPTPPPQPEPQVMAKKRARPITAPIG